VTRRSGVVIVGSINLDYVVSLRRRPDPGETVSDAVLELHPGGKGANQAVAAARSGVGVEIVGCVGADAAGGSRVRELIAERVGVSHVRRVVGTTTGIAIVMVTPDGENAIVGVPGANAELCLSDIDQAAGVIAEGHVLVTQLEVPLACVTRAARIAPPDITFVLNAAPYRTVPISVLQRVDVLVVNESEAAGFTGWQVDSVEDARRAAGEVRRLGPKAVVITLGPAGAVVAAAGLDSHVVAPVVRCVDTTGAGDAFVGALAASLANGESLHAAVVYGTAMGSATTEHRGASPVLPSLDHQRTVPG